MSNDQIDPSGNTEAFQAFAGRISSGETDVVAGKRSLLGIAVSAIAAVIIVAAVIWYFVAT